MNQAVTAARVEKKDEVEVVPLSRLELRYEPRVWPWALANRTAIGSHFASARRYRPALFNGPVFLIHTWAIENGTLRAGLLETDFASFLAWRDAGFPDRSVVNCFAMGALRGSDGAYVLGVRNSHVTNAGMIYFPSASPEPRDLRSDASFDLTAAIQREFFQDTGLLAETAPPGPVWHAVIVGPRMALIRPLLARESGERLATRIRANIARERQPDISDVVVVGGPADFRPEMPDFVRAYIGFRTRAVQSVA